MPVAKVNGINLVYNVKGNGPPLVLIIGFASAQNLWYSTVGAFSKSYRVVTFDNRGFGKSDKPPGPYTTRMLADDTLGLMDHLGIKKAHILGGSLGGMVAQEIAIGHPERLDNLILSATSAGGKRLHDMFAGMIKASYPDWDPAKPEDLTPARLQQFMVAMASVSFDGMAKKFLMPLIGWQARRGKVEVPLGQLQAMLSHDTLERLGSIQAPTLVLTGGKDQLIPSGSAQELASRIKRAKLVVIEKGAHALGGKKFNEEVLGFLNGK
jgi:3-oxoadipate enol-lactonase